MTELEAMLLIDLTNRGFDAKQIAIAIEWIKNLIEEAD